MSNGFVRDTVSGAVIVTTSTVGAVMSDGFIRDPDGRLVVIAV